MCGLYPLVPALPFWPALPLQLFPALGYIPGESPGAEQLPAAPLLTHIPLFFFFTPFLLSLGLSLSLSLSDSTCNNTVTFLHLLLHHYY